MYTKLYDELTNKKSFWRNEEEVRQGWISALSNELLIPFTAERDRVDSGYNNVIIEFKSKGLFNGSTSSAKFLEARDLRLKKYIINKAANEGIDVSDYIGIGIDADHIFCAQIIDNQIVNGPLLPFSETSVSMVASACKNSYRRAVTSENLIEDFGLGSMVGSKMMSILIAQLSTKINHAEHSKEKMLFEEWQSLYGQIADLAQDQVKKVESLLGFHSTAPNNLQVPSSLFVIHTYNSLLIKLLAAEIICSHNLASYPYFSQQALSLHDEDLLTSIRTDIEQGQLFSRANIKGFVEEAIFSWYDDACKEPHFKVAFVSGLRELLLKISLYRTDKLNIARSTDVLKQLYQHLVPEQLRKSLGEFYTPDWLVDVTVDKLEPTNWSQKRVLDPTCGSGSFLLEIINRKRKSAQALNLSNLELLKDITQNVWGFDLNPLAVQTARVNFVIAISDLLKKETGWEIEVPVLLADAVYSPARNPSAKEDFIRYKIGSQIADLEIILPVTLALDRTRLDLVFSCMERNVEQSNIFADVKRDLIAMQIATEDELIDWGQYLNITYDKVLALHNKNWNGIWFRIVRNFFWSATAGQFDYITGNPPWVRWSKLPQLYRDRAKPTCMQYEIFSSTPHHGGNELDISAMITYTVTDKWLKPEGTLVFVITQTLLQTPSSEGFRRFRINGDYNLLPLSVDDLKTLSPFKGIKNRTAILVLKKTKNNGSPYPVPYTEWTNATNHQKSIPEYLNKNSVLERTVRIDMEAIPIGKLGSPWAILPPGRFSQLSGLQGRCDWVQGRKGITADLNGVFFVNVLDFNISNNRVQVSTRPQAGKRDIGPAQTFWIEPTLLYPLLKGSSDFKACRITRNHKLYTILPNNGISRTNYEEALFSLRTDHPKTLKYFEAFRSILESRSTYRLRMPNAPYFAVYNVGSYTFAPWKVVWAEQGKFRAAVVSSDDVPLIGRRPFVPDHKIFFADFYDSEPAYYLCGLLNAKSVKEYIESHNIEIQIGDVFKHLSLPEFNPFKKQHLELSELVQTAHYCPEAQYLEVLDKIYILAEAILLPNLPIQAI